MFKATISKVVSIYKSGLDKRLKDVEIVAMCDIDNPPFGEEGASYVFAPQKGEYDKMVKIFDDGVKNLCNVVKNCLGKRPF